MGQGHNLDLFGILALVVLMMILRASAEVDLSTRLQQCSDAQLPEEKYVEFMKHACEYPFTVYL